MNFGEPAAQLCQSYMICKLENEYNIWDLPQFGEGLVYWEASMGKVNCYGGSSLNDGIGLNLLQGGLIPSCSPPEGHHCHYYYHFPDV